MVNTVEWSDLPDDVISRIAACLDCRVDVLRILGVCQSWRSSLRRYMDTKKALTPLHTLLELPSPCSRRIKRANLKINRKLSQTAVYRIQPKGESGGPNSRKVWFLKLEEVGPNQMRILNPLSYFRSKSLPSSFPKMLNLLDYSITQISTGYAVKDLEIYPYRKSSFRMSTFSHKAVLYPDNIWTPLEDLTIFMLRQKGNLYFCKHGDEKWIRINDKKDKLSDIVVYRNKVYVVNRSGEVWTIDSGMKMVKYAPSLYGGGRGHMKHLVFSNGQLKLLDRLAISTSSLSESDAYVEDTLDEERGSSEYYDDWKEGRDDIDNPTQSHEVDEDEIEKHEDDDSGEACKIPAQLGVESEEKVMDKNEMDEHDDEGEEGDDEKENDEGKDEKKATHFGKAKWDLQEKANVDKDMKDEPRIVSRYERCCFKWRNVVGLEVYNLDEDLGWVEAENLGDQVWFIAYESIFCLKTEELHGFKGDCMYLLKQNVDNDDVEDHRLSETGVRMFEMEKSRRKRRMRKVQSFPGPALMFWPSLLPSTSSSSG